MKPNCPLAWAKLRDLMIKAEKRSDLYGSKCSSTERFNLTIHPLAAHVWRIGDDGVVTTIGQELGLTQHG